MKNSTIVWTALACLAVSAVALSETPTTSTTADVLRQARVYLFQFRTGQFEVASKSVVMLEEATKSDPENAELWNAMGNAYLAQGAGAILSGGNPADAMIAVQKGPQALERALKLNPDHAEALATHGGMQAMMATMMPSSPQAPQMAAKGVAEMNRAVELAPNSVRVRLQRAFSGLSLPDGLRNNAAESEDLDFLIKIAEGSRPGGYLHIMRGDLYYEMAKPELAKSQYEMAAQPASPAATEAQGRLNALIHGGPAIADIKKLRNAAGANCVMCHGK